MKNFITTCETCYSSCSHLSPSIIYSFGECVKGVFFEQSCLNLGFFSLFAHMVSYEMQCSFTFNKEGKKPSAHINNTIDCLVTVTFYCCFNYQTFFKFKGDFFVSPLFIGEFWLLSRCIVMFIFFSAILGKILLRPTNKCIWSLNILGINLWRSGPEFP